MDGRDDDLTARRKLGGNDETLLGGKTVVIGAHPDDAEINAGGLISLVKDSLIVTVMSGHNHTRDAELARREQAAASAVLDRKSVNLGFHTVEMNRALVTALDEAIEDAVTVVTHHPDDSNHEHAIVSQAVIAASRTTDNLMFFEPIPPAGRMGFTPNLWVDISNVAPLKYRAIECYTSQLMRKGRDLILTRRELDCWRGCEVGVDYAETYSIRRMFV